MLHTLYTFTYRILSHVKNPAIRRISFEIKKRIAQEKNIKDWDCQFNFTWPSIIEGYVRFTTVHLCLSISRLTRVNLNSNQTVFLYRACDARQVRARPYPLPVSTLMTRPDFLQYLAYHRHIWPIPPAKFVVIYNEDLFCLETPL